MKKNTMSHEVNIYFFCDSNYSNTRTLTQCLENNIQFVENFIWSSNKNKNVRKAIEMQIIHLCLKIQIHSCLGECLECSCTFHQAWRGDLHL